MRRIVQRNEREVVIFHLYLVDRARVLPQVPESIVSQPKDNQEHYSIEVGMRHGNHCLPVVTRGDDPKRREAALPYVIQ